MSTKIKPQMRSPNGLLFLLFPYVGDAKITYCFMKGGIDMKNKIGLIKVLGMALTIGGTIASSWSGEKEQKETLKKLVKEEMKRKK